MNDLNTSQISDVEVFVPETEDNASPKKAGKSKKVIKIIVGLLALIGFAVVAVVVYAVIAASREQPASQTIDETSAVERVMEHAYGKYSPSRRGWMYVSESGATYLVTVVQQKKIEAVGKGDELYLVTSGTRIAGEATAEDEDARTLYGIFKVTASDDVLTPVSRPANFGGTVPLSPERVKFVAFNQDHWGWVLKHVSEGAGVQTTINEVLVASENEIHPAGQFESAYDNTKAVTAAHGSCALASAAHANWMEQSALQNASGDLVDKPGETVPSEVEPQRCTKYAVTFRTDPVTEKFFTALNLTSTGIRDGQPFEPKKWKVMFDQKSFTYLLPIELEAELDDFFRRD